MAAADTGSGDRFVTSDGTALHVTDSGPADAAATVLFVHGWTQDHTCWNLAAADMPDDVRVVRYDHRGHGVSAPARSGTRTLEQLADDLAEVIDAVVPTGPIVLVGHSMGGMTLMALAERHPALVESRVAGVAFVATSSGDMHRISLGLKGAMGRSVPRVEPVLRSLLERRKKGNLPGNPRLLAPAGRWLVFGKKPKPEHVIETVRQSLAAHPASIGGFMDAIFAHDRRVALGALRDKPTVVLVGDRDRLCPADHAKVIADELPGTDFVLYPGAGHMLMYERSLEVNTRILALLRKAVPAC
ncbi:MAG: alpha/beta fold hydrolase [Actinophytocola sp.]|nr:alpha/beta fold hydrolase [Actinophytocola sp.]